MTSATRALFQQAGPAVPLATDIPDGAALWCRERSAHRFTAALEHVGDRVRCDCGAVEATWVAAPRPEPA